MRLPHRFHHFSFAFVPSELTLRDKEKSERKEKVLALYQYPDCPPPPCLIQMEDFTKRVCFFRIHHRRKNTPSGCLILCLNYSVGYLRWTSNIDVYRNKCAVILMINCAESGEYCDVAHVNEPNEWKT